MILIMMIKIQSLPEWDDVRMIETSEVFNIRLLNVAYFLHGNRLTVELPEENRPLRSAAQPLQVWYILKRNFPEV